VSRQATIALQLNYQEKIMAMCARLMCVALACAALFTGAAATGAGAAAPRHVIKVSYVNHPGEAVDIEIRYWAKLVEERSKGEVKLELFPSSQLGTQQEVFEQALMGANVIGMADPGNLGEWVPDFTILSGPYLGEWDKIFKLIHTDWFKGLEKKLADKGLVGMSYNWMYGSRSLVATRPVLKPEDMKSMKIRVPNVKIQIEAFKAMGATPTPMPLAEVYPALTQGVMDGAENPLNVLYGQKLYEPTKNLMLIEYLNMILTWIAGTAYLDTLPADVVQMLKDTCAEAGEYSKKIVPEEDLKILALMEKEGVKIFKVDKEPFKQASKAAYSQFPNWTPNLYETVQEIMEKL
jgi:tripartite ATP-independent transporter DctP family solute receptor